MPKWRGWTWMWCLAALGVAFFAGFLTSRNLISAQVLTRIRKEALFPRFEYLIEEHYATWTSGKVLDTLVVPFCGDLLRVEIVFDDREDVAGFCRRSDLSISCQHLEAVVSEANMRVILYRDFLWVYISKREYHRLKELALKQAKL